MRALLDVNVLLALFDAGHIHHRAAADWLLANAREGWASCPLTQNGCLRVLSQPSYSSPQPAASIAARLAAAFDDSHEFWPDSVSLVDEGRLRWDRVLTSRQITDAYLLALAVARGGRLVSFDRSIPTGAVRGAGAKHLVVLGDVA